MYVDQFLLSVLIFCFVLFSVYIIIFTYSTTVHILNSLRLMATSVACRSIDLS